MGVAALPIAIAAGGYSIYSQTQANRAQGKANRNSADLAATNAYREGALSEFNAEMTKELADMQADYLMEKATVDAWSQALQGEYESNILYSNAKVSNRNSANVRAATAYATGRMEDANKRAAATQITQYAASGVRQSGTAIDVQYDSALNRELDVLANEYNGSIEALGYEYEADISEWQGNVTKQMSEVQAQLTLWGGSEEAKLTRAAGEANATSLLMQAKQYRANAQEYSRMGVQAISQMHSQNTAIMVNGLVNMAGNVATMSGGGGAKSSGMQKVGVGRVGTAYRGQDWNATATRSPSMSTSTPGGLKINELRIVA